MGRTLLIGRLTARDLRRRPTQAALLLLAITAASAVLTLGLVLHGVTNHPYQQTRAATRGPDVVAQFSGPVTAGPFGPHSRPPGQVKYSPEQIAANARQVRIAASELIHAAGVTAHSGLYPVASAVVRAGGRLAAVVAEGRDPTAAAVDQPELTSGHWISAGGIVLERTYAEALRVGLGDRITLNGRPFRVVGTAVTAASVPMPNMCFINCNYGLPFGPRGISPRHLGLAWITRAGAQALATSSDPLGYVLNLKLSDPGQAQAFVNRYGHQFAENSATSTAPSLTTWQDIRNVDGLLIRDEAAVLNPGAWLATLLAIGTLAVLAGGRMSERIRRVGLLKAVGATPGIVTLALMAENLILALAAAIAGLAIGRLAAPLITSPGAGLVGAPGAPSLTLPTAGLVVGVALVVAMAATLWPAIRAARTSTVSALADPVRRPRRRAGLIRLSRHLPVPLLFGLRLVARRPRRALLSAACIAITMTGVVTVLAFHATADEKLFGSGSGLIDPVIARDTQMLLVVTVVLLALSGLNAVCTAWATVLDARQASAVARALGASPEQVTAGVVAAQVLSAIPGVLAGIPLGIALFSAANSGGITTVPPAWWLLLAALGTLLAVAALTAIPARAGARQPVAGILRSESA
ncbi:MAG: FtsX-like permease family protein [Streptosporangiaceae bacterium]